MSSIWQQEGFARNFATPDVRRNLYAFSTCWSGTDHIIFALLVHQFRADRRKSQADLIKDLYLLERVPSVLTENGFIGPLNVSTQTRSQFAGLAQDVTDRIDRIGMSFSDKMAKGGNSLTGLLKVVDQKITGNSKLPADLFDEVVDSIKSEIFENLGRGGGFDPKRTYKPSSKYAKEVIYAKVIFTKAGFDARFLGVY